MAHIAAYEDMKSTRRLRQEPEGDAWRTPFLVPPPNVDGEPHAYLVEDPARRVIRTHFHIVDQFQVIVSGGGVLGKHELRVHAVHFARAHTPYGPIVAGKDGLGFLTLRATSDPGAQRLPEKKEQLKSIPNRKPWQVTEAPRFDDTGEVVAHTFSKITDGHGLGAYALKLRANAQTSAPDPSTSGGQYLIITKGSMVHQGRYHQAITIVFVKPHEHAFPLVAGDAGMEALVLNFPRRVENVQTTDKVVPSIIGPFRVWQCQLCAFTYDESKGLPDEGVPAGTRWEDVPESWTCPDCSTNKGDFEMGVVR